MRIIYLKKEKEKKKIQNKHQIFFEYNILQLLYSSCTSLNLYDNRGNRSIRDRPIFLSSRQPMIYCPSPKSFIHQCPRRTNREGRGEAKASERASERARARERDRDRERQSYRPQLVDTRFSRRDYKLVVGKRTVLFSPDSNLSKNLVGNTLGEKPVLSIGI